MDYYSTLGVNRSASPDEIKKAYKKMAMKHHPDRGGDEQKFKEVEEAYRTLSDPQKKQMFDMGVDPNRNQSFGQGSPFEFHFGTGNMDDIFANFGFGMRPGRGNKNLSIAVDITLEDVLNGKTINAEVSARNGKPKFINIEIPPGIEHGQQIRYEGMGDDSISSFRPGDLIVNVRIITHRLFKREGTNVLIEKTISVWDAMLGCELETETLNNKHLKIIIPPGTQPETVFSCRGEGLPNMRSRIRGNLMIKVKIAVPKNLTVSQIEKINQIKNGI
jgi:curved DNA-binding protein